MTTPGVGWYLFWLGLAAGIACLDAAVYRKVSPRWLRWLLLGLSLCLVCRYVMMAGLAQAHAPRLGWWLRPCWIAAIAGLTLPGAFVLDQLVRHPAWSALRVLRCMTPWLLAYALIMCVGRMELVNDPSVGWHPRLLGFWRWLLMLAQGLFVAGFVALCALILRQVRSRRVRVALTGLILAYVALSICGALLANGRMSIQPFLYSEIFVLAALAHAFDTAIQRAG